ncbi:hypothetical protein [Rheinheimera maricola]|uniref:Outer membrane protein beta-barrel domain-containing protein n=1 Tax=Rheinheimera maricola TaxID=2793282 RepID=A0ABS7XA22_9GAMM|nr:hypothetical protein [Rheinheimera maricola]MBZ9611578.1 hypothetical protein [Rheinheimera maricola]
MKKFVKINKMLLLAAGMLVTFTATAESSWSVGHGYTSGGVVGAQYQWRQDDIKFTAAAGALGLAVGVQRSIDDARKHSIGLATGVEAITANKGFLLGTYQYYPAGFANSGMRWGLSAGVRRDDGTGWGEEKTKAAVSLEIGYQF